MIVGAPISSMEPTYASPTYSGGKVCQIILLNTLKIGFYRRNLVYFIEEFFSLPRFFSPNLASIQIFTNILEANIQWHIFPVLWLCVTLLLVWIGFEYDFCCFFGSMSMWNNDILILKRARLSIFFAWTAYHYIALYWLGWGP